MKKVGSVAYVMQVDERVDIDSKMQSCDRMDGMAKLGLYDVLGYWLESQIGCAKRMKPSSCETIEASGATQETRLNCQTVVESIKGYDDAKSNLVKWMTNGLPDLEPITLFLNDLDSHIQKYPVHRTTSRDIEEQAKKPVTWWSYEEVAKELGMKVQSVRNLVYTGKLKRVITFQKKTTIDSHEVVLYKNSLIGVR